MLQRIALGSCLFAVLGMGVIVLMVAVGFTAITSASNGPTQRTCSIDSGSTNATCVSLSGVQAGYIVTGTGIAGGTTVSSISGNSFTLSLAATQTIAIDVLTFTPPPPPPTGSCPTPMPSGQTCVIDNFSGPYPANYVGAMVYACTAQGVYVPPSCGEPIFSDTPLLGFTPYSGIPGQCYWWAYYNYPHAGLPGTAYAYQLWYAWAGLAPEGSSPRDGSLVIFNHDIGVYGYAGHVALVVKVDTAGGKFLVSEMNYFGNYIVSDRWVSDTDPAILGFIYRPYPVS